MEEKKAIAEPRRIKPEPMLLGEHCRECDSLIKSFHWQWCSKNAVRREPLAPQAPRTSKNLGGRPRKYGNWS